MSENKQQHIHTEQHVQSQAATEQQAANAAGADNNEQGKASFITGATTGGGSNYGQGSHHLGGESYRQGDTVNSGTNYSNESDMLGASSTGTSSEGSSSANAGAAQSGRTGEETKIVANDARNADITSQDEHRGQTEGMHKELEEGDRRDTSLEQDSGLSGNDGSGAARRESGSWSQSSTSK